MANQFLDCHEQKRKNEFQSLVNQVNEKLQALLSEEARERLKGGSSLEEEVKAAAIPKKFREEYTKILHNTEAYSSRIFRCEVLLMELQKY